MHIRARLWGERILRHRLFLRDQEFGVRVDRYCFREMDLERCEFAHVMR